MALLTSAAVGLLAGTALAAAAPQHRPGGVSDPIGLGSCLGPNGPIELRRAMFLENRVAEFTNRDEPIRVSLVSQSVRIEPMARADGTLYQRHIASMVAQGEEDADLFLKLALLDGRPFIYWRETYQHRIYRQGLFEIVAHDLVPYCEGHGGTASSH